MGMRTLTRIGLLLALVAGCNGSGSMSPPKNGYQIKTPPLMLNAGEEKYLCYTVKLNEPADVAVVEFESTTTSTVHHFEVFQALAPEQDGLFDCSSSLIKISWLPLFGGGANAGGLKLPAGAGFQIPKNAQLLVQLHMLNATGAPSSSTVTVDMTYAADASKVTPAGIYAVGSQEINLPPNSSNVTVSSPNCQLNKQLNVFAVQPHMHTLGTRILFQHGASATSMQTEYQRDPWVFGLQPIDQLQMTLNAGDFVSASCTYDNNTTNTVSYGESTKDEMCYFVLFYTPFDHLDGCIN